MGYKFEPKKYSEKIEVFGHTFNIDFSNDEVIMLFATSTDNENNINEDYRKNRESGMPDAEATLLLRNQMRESYEIFFNKITGDPSASDKCFEKDTPISVYRDLYLFIYGLYIDKMSLGTLNVNREQRRKKRK